MEKGILYVVATPIGNLQDITLRAIETLKSVDLVACEDTRVTKKLLNHYEIRVSVTSYFQHSKLSKINFLISELESGKNIAIVTDAGTPGISDPGNKLISEILKAGINVVPVPGVSALTALISVAGIDMQKFVFLGFPPHKKGRETFFREVAGLHHPVVYYDSTHRLIKNLRFLSEELNSPKNVIVGKEMTKFFEEIVRGNIPEVVEYFEKNKDKIKGEFVIIVY